MSNKSNNHENHIIGKRIVQLRKYHDWSQKYLAVKLGLNPPTLHRYEKGTSIIPSFVVKRIAEIFNCNLYWLFGFEDEGLMNINPIKDVIKAYENIRDNECNAKKSIKIYSPMFSPFNWTEDYLDCKIEQYITEGRISKSCIKVIKNILRDRKEILLEKNNSNTKFTIKEIISDPVARRFFKHMTNTNVSLKIKLDLINSVQDNEKRLLGKLKYIFIDKYIPINIELIDDLILHIQYFFKYKLFSETFFLTFTKPSFVDNFIRIFNLLFSKSNTALKLQNNIRKYKNDIMDVIEYEDMKF